MFSKSITWSIQTKVRTCRFGQQCQLAVRRGMACWYSEFMFSNEFESHAEESKSIMDLIHDDDLMEYINTMNTQLMSYISKPKYANDLFQ